MAQSMKVEEVVQNLKGVLPPVGLVVAMILHVHPLEIRKGFQDFTTK